jgi:hypothetical protein
MQRIDFHRSDIRWVTKENGSHGAFVLEAVLRRWAYPSGSPTIYALGAPVLAGNMYHKKGLCKDPPYMFQIAAGVADHVIFRTSVSAPALNSTGRQNDSDTSGSNSSVFESLAITLNHEPAKSLSDYDEIAEHYFHRDIFTCIITTQFPGTGKIELEFPVKHLNLLPKCKMWQLETGPVLFLKQGFSFAEADETLTDLLSYFVFVNRFDSAEFFPDFPFGQGAVPRAPDAVTGDIRCQVKLLVGNV